MGNDLMGKTQKIYKKAAVMDQRQKEKGQKDYRDNAFGDDERIRGIWGQPGTVEQKRRAFYYQGKEARASGDIKIPGKRSGSKKAREGRTKRKR